MVYDVDRTPATCNNKQCTTFAVTNGKSINPMRKVDVGVREDFLFRMWPRLAKAAHARAVARLLGLPYRPEGQWPVGVDMLKIDLPKSVDDLSSIGPSCLLWTIKWYPDAFHSLSHHSYNIYSSLR